MARLNAADRRATLIDATIKTMIEKGFARATTRDVAARLGIGRGLIHHYFATWEALQHAAFEALGLAAQRDVESRLSGLLAAERLDALLAAILAEPGDAHWRLFADAWDEAQRDSELARIHGNIGRWWRELIGETLSAMMPAEHDADSAAWRLAALADGLSGHVLLAEPTLTRSDALRLLKDAARMELLAARASTR